MSRLPTTSKQHQFLVYGLSDIGLSRSNNEDVWVAVPEQGFFALADGMGGHQAGEVAAKETISILLQSLESLKTRQSLELVRVLKKAIEDANQWVFHLSKEVEAYYGMGTTLCCLLWTQEAVIYAHVGDSRIYRLRKGKLELLTRDHSLFSEWLETGRLGEEKGELPSKNVLTKAVGTHAKVVPEIAFSAYEPDDLYLLCSDGLSDALSLREMETAFSEENLLSSTKRLISLAKEKGASDNITALLVKIRPLNVF